MRRWITSFSFRHWSSYMWRIDGRTGNTYHYRFPFPNLDRERSELFNHATRLQASPTWSVSQCIIHPAKVRYFSTPKPPENLALFYPEKSLAASDHRVDGKFSLELLASTVFPEHTHRSHLYCSINTQSNMGNSRLWRKSQESPTDANVRNFFWKVFHSFSSGKCL